VVDISLEMNKQSDSSDASDVHQLVVALPFLIGAVVWASWPTLAEMARKWENDPQYSHGYLVPLFSGFLLWLRRDKLQSARIRPSWWGLVLLLIGVGLKIAGGYFTYGWIDAVSLLPCLAGLFLFVGGWTALQWSWPAVAFLFFMIPLPYRLEIALQSPLMKTGTVASVYVMQTLGLSALAEGNVIVLDDEKIGVAEACSGLRMLMIFFALSTAVALFSDRPLAERFVVVLSAVPIAIIANVARITLTGSLYATGESELARKAFHDWSGLLMMPFGLVLLWVEIWLLSKLFIVDDQRPMHVGLQVSDKEPTTS